MQIRTWNWKNCFSTLTSNDSARTPWAFKRCIWERNASSPKGLRWYTIADTQHAVPARVPVIVVGAGPTGLTLSSLLGKLGIPNLVLDSAPALPKHPQAHFINNRSMEVFRPLDGLADEIAACSPPLAEWRKFIYCESLTGRIFGQVDHFQGAQGIRARLHQVRPQPAALSAAPRWRFLHCAAPPRRTIPTSC